MKDTIKRIRNEREGFTLAELLIVVAIIAVLVAIAIPVFSAQLEKSREATDAANIRAAYAEAMTVALQSNDGTGTATSVEMTQTKAGWDNFDGKIAGQYDPSNTDGLKDVVKGNTVTVSIAADGTVTFSHE